MLPVHETEGNSNEELQRFYDIDVAEILSDVQDQWKLFYRIFPDQVEVGPNKSKTFDWMLTRVSDGSGEAAPRELIHFLSSARDKQLETLEVGAGDDIDQTLFDRASLKRAMPPVSEARFDQTLCAEHPALAVWLRRLEGQKTEQRPDTLANIWQVPGDEARKIADELVEVGFFERKKDSQESNYPYKVPFLYRPALEMVQGKAD